MFSGYLSPQQGTQVSNPTIITNVSGLTECGRISYTLVFASFNIRSNSMTHQKASVGKLRSYLQTHDIKKFEIIRFFMKRKRRRIERFMSLFAKSWPNKISQKTPSYFPNSSWGASVPVKISQGFSSSSRVNKNLRNNSAHEKEAWEDETLKSFLRTHNKKAFKNLILRNNSIPNVEKASEMESNFSCKL